jgi:hypothetical protein
MRIVPCGSARDFPRAPTSGSAAPLGGGAPLGQRAAKDRARGSEAPKRSKEVTGEVIVAPSKVQRGARGLAAAAYIPRPRGLRSKEGTRIHSTARGNGPSGRGSSAMAARPPDSVPIRPEVLEGGGARDGDGSRGAGPTHAGCEHAACWKVRPTGRLSIRSSWSSTAPARARSRLSTRATTRGRLRSPRRRHRRS